mmetsp:Transcript_30524/g.74339  ORF Transcript_30524/g.74339 Transcript_30524/m.74339 type:complete len:124 (+) Transcript_30524:138-509(+)
MNLAIYTVHATKNSSERTHVHSNTVKKVDRKASTLIQSICWESIIKFILFIEIRKVIIFVSVFVVARTTVLILILIFLFIFQDGTISAFLFCLSKLQALAVIFVAFNPSNVYFKNLLARFQTN